ncbi:hypothetical protein BGZ61DRAFT_520725 [Ilyonectria robusta]|uniref:uncharacterized protein n=1 Tax=Ilyonectria robusta TaxID=1079257 RepID=UPI001E8E1A13|nr:uncharacterized protein BGZ61DRAFT_520725 [Ilyonectria robusta]KAH8677208.1 hypothetical protein BGZ61DRAFT_520725 [Ilyonectria robusta]
MPSFRPASATMPGDDGRVIPPDEVHHQPEDGRGDAEFSPEMPFSGRAPAWDFVAIAETLAPRQRPATRSMGGEPLGRHGAAGAQPASHGVAVARPSARGITSLPRRTPVVNIDNTPGPRRTTQPAGRRACTLGLVSLEIGLKGFGGHRSNWFLDALLTTLPFVVGPQGAAPA